MGKYDPLGHFLASQKSSIIRLDFQDIEGALGFRLPVSAGKHPEWWSNNYGGHVQARAWMDAGWQTEAVDLAGKKVSFRRLSPSEIQNLHDRKTTAPVAGSRPRGARWGCMAGTVTFVPGVDLTEPTEDWDAERDASR